MGDSCTSQPPCPTLEGETMKTKILVPVISAILVFIFSTVIVLAQADQARIAGTVTDSNGAVVPGAKVRVVDTAV